MCDSAVCGRTVCIRAVCGRTVGVYQSSVWYKVVQSVCVAECESAVCGHLRSSG